MSTECPSAEGLCQRQRHQQRQARRWRIQRVPGLALGRQTQSQCGQPGGHRLPQTQQLQVTALPGSLIAPSKPDCGGLERWRHLCASKPHPQGPAQPTIVLSTHRIAAAPQHRRTGADASKQIEHQHRPKPPVPRKAHNPPQGRVIAHAIGPRRVQPDEQQRRLLRLPLPPQPPPVAPTSANGGVSISGGVGVGVEGVQRTAGRTASGHGDQLCGHLCKHLCDHICEHRAGTSLHRV